MGDFADLERDREFEEHLDEIFKIDDNIMGDFEDDDICDDCLDDLCDY